MGLTKKTLKTGAGLAGLAAAAAAAYFLTGERGERTRTLAKGWMLKMKADVLDGVEKMKTANEGAYHVLVDKASAKYRSFREANKAEFDALHKELKGAWGRFQSHAVPSGRKPPSKKRAAPSRRTRA